MKNSISIFVALLGTLLCVNPAHASNRYWYGASCDSALWYAGGNISWKLDNAGSCTSIATSDDAWFAGAATGTVSIRASSDTYVSNVHVTANGYTFNNYGGNYPAGLIVSGGHFTISSGIIAIMGYATYETVFITTGTTPLWFDGPGSFQYSNNSHNYFTCQRLWVTGGGSIQQGSSMGPAPATFYQDACKLDGGASIIVYHTPSLSANVGLTVGTGGGTYTGGNTLTQTYNAGWDIQGVLTIGPTLSMTLNGPLRIENYSGTAMIQVKTTLNMSSSYAIEVDTASPLAPGSYTLISKVSGTGVAGSVPSAVTVGGSGLVANTTASLAIASGELVMTVSCVNSADPTSASAGAATICNGSSTTLTLNGGGGGAYETVRWYTGSCGGTAAGTGNGLSVSPTTTTTYYGRYEDGSPCGYNSACQSVTVTVNQPSVGGSASSSEVCSGSAATVSLGGQTGNIQKWQSSPDHSTWTDIASTANPYTTPALTATTYYRAVVANGVCSAASSAYGTITVDGAPAGGSASSSEICSGSAAMVSLSGQTGNIQKWQSSPNHSTWTDVASTANPYTTPALTATTYYRAVVASGVCSTASSAYGTVTVDGASAGGSASSSEICSGSAATVSLSGQTGNIQKWQSSPDHSAWTDIPSTANPYTTPALTATTYYRAVVTNGACSAASSAYGTVTVDGASAGGSASSSEICSGSAATVSLSGQTGNIQKWQSSPNHSTWTDIASTANPYTTPALTATTYYRAVVTNGVCSSANSAYGTVTVDGASAGGSASSSEICSGSAATVSLSGQTGNIQKWQSSPDHSIWTDIASTANPYTTPALTATTYYRAVVANGVCSAANSAYGTVTVDGASAGGSASSSEICSGSAATVSLSGQTGNIPEKWQSSPDHSIWTDIASTANPYTTPALTATTYYRAVVTNGVCGWVNSAYGTVTVGAPPVALETNYTRVQGQDLTIQISDLLSGGAIFQGVNSGTNGAQVSSDDTYIYYYPTNESDDTLTYTVTNSAGCLASASISISVTSAPTGGCDLGADPNPCCLGSNVTFTAVLNGWPALAEKPTGEVVFLAGGVAFSTNGLVNGVATASTASLPLGTNVIQAEYAGDNNFLGGSTTVSQVVRVVVPGSSTNVVLSVVNNGNGSFTISFVGTPNTQYYLVSSSDVTAPFSTWTPLPGSTNTAPSPDGQWSFIVSNAAPQFYRSVALDPYSP